ncbi:MULTISPECIES: type VII secretion protein EccCa [unclassified Nocardioides]|uniref:type VII secretion protein EccCa n=1 Tax=unclassified Nocardioides TaxID=2615069 RepID=UPI000701C095|nr:MULTISPECIES: type VII secretion protein EccCa [unclassified Nocardioides]KQY56345.1 secretion protein EccC [Nocardioides sp. Root140]KQZ75130.1 secretion protein EccC [Nocardioides sp. Root151]KRF14208.1 secretion protein EccC [Nocardioides sp. Soil796]
MGTQLFKRPARQRAPREPRGEIVLESPPELPETTQGGGVGQALTMLPMLAGAGGMGLMMTARGGTGGSPIMMLAMGMMAVAFAGMMVGNIGRQSGEKRRKLDGDRRDYQRYLVQVRRRVRKAVEQQRKAALWHHPDPASLWCLALGTRLWERRATDVDHLAVRIGRGPQRLAVTLVTPETKPVEDLEPISAGALRRFVGTHKSVPDLPVAVSLRAFGLISLNGQVDQTRAMARAMIAQLATLQSPDDVRIAVCAGKNTVSDWEWLKWLPHALSEDTDAVGQVRLVRDDLIAIEARLGDLLSSRPRFGADAASDGPHLVVVLDGGRVPPEAQLAAGLVQGVTVVDLRGVLPTEHSSGVLQLELRKGTVSIVRKEGTSGDITRSPLGAPDALSTTECTTLARAMTRYRMSAGAENDPTDLLTVDVTLPELLRLGDPHNIDTDTTWRPRAARNRLRVPIGVGPTGHPVDLDIKESAQGGMGPHGLVIGATGSGKSELLRTLVLGLAVSHSPEMLNFVLVDFKGGATFASMDVLPHTSAVITNLEDELILVDRMKDAIAGEMVRRQEALRAAGNYSSLKDYEKAREQGAPLDPMPSLFIVVDEFSELLSAKPDFIDLFVMIGRLGRSLGVHLLLASQRLEEGKLRGLDTHLSYRVGLRTFSAMESRTVLGVADAYELPSAPGHGYLKEASEGLVRFRAAYVSAPYKRNPNAVGAGLSESAVGGYVLPYEVAYLEPRQQEVEPEDTTPEAEPTGPSETLMEIMVDRLKGRGTPARQVWLPPLDESPSLNDLLPPLAETEHGLRPGQWDNSRMLSAPIGIEDKPFEQRRDPLWVGLASSHAVVVGGPQSGKSTLLRTLISGLALTHTPQQVQFYCIDFGGGTLSGLSDLPHVGSVATRMDPERLRRTVSEMNALIDGREAHFTAKRIDSMQTYRRMVASGAEPGDGFGDVFLVVDGWGTVRQDHEAMEAQITKIATRGLGFGVHVVVSIQRWMELRPALRDLIGQRLELRLGDPAESDVDRRAAKNVPEKMPGRGLSVNKLHYLTALPRIDGSSSSDDVADGVADMVKRVRNAWTGPEAPEVRLLPRKMPYDQLPVPDEEKSALPLGLDEDTLSPVFVNFDAEPHFLILGDVESGKSNVLRAIARGITTRWDPKQAKIVTFDYRWGMIGAVTTGHQLAYVTNSGDAPEMVKQIASAMRDRLAGIKVDPTAQEVPRWEGPKLFVLIDDYEMIAAAQPNPLHALLEFLPQARDIGLHVVLTRSAGGSGGGSFEPLQKRLKELGTPGLLLSGSKEEGAVLHGNKFEPQPQGRGKLVDRRTGVKVIQTPIMTK